MQGGKLLSADNLSVQQTNIERCIEPGLYRRWILANTLGWALSVGLVLGSIGFLIFAVCLLPVPGFLGTWLLYLLQVSVLQRELGQEAARKFAKASWIGAGVTLAAETLLSALFFMFAAVLGMGGASDKDPVVFIVLAIPSVPMIVTPFLAGWLTSRAQWRSVLKARFSSSGPWIVANILGWGLSWLIGLACMASVAFFNMLRIFDLSGPMDWVPVGGVLGFLVGSVIGLVNGSVTGRALTRLLQNLISPVPPWPDAQTAPDPSRTMT